MRSGRSVHHSPDVGFGLGWPLIRASCIQCALLRIFKRRRIPAVFITSNGGRYSNLIASLKLEEVRFAIVAQFVGGFYDVSSAFRAIAHFLANTNTITANWFSAAGANTHNACILPPPPGRSLGAWQRRGALASSLVRRGPVPWLLVLGPLSTSRPLWANLWLLAFGVCAIFAVYLAQVKCANDFESDQLRQQQYTKW